MPAVYDPCALVVDPVPADERDRVDAQAFLHVPRIKWDTRIRGDRERRGIADVVERILDGRLHDPYLRTDRHHGATGECADKKQDREYNEFSQFILQSMR